MWRNWRQNLGGVIAAIFGWLVLALMIGSRMPVYDCNGDWICTYFFPLCCWEYFFVR